MKLSRRTIVGLAIAFIAFILLIFLSAPNNSTNSGSTYSNAPQGYGAWYAYMLNRKLPVQRWEKPLNNFLSKEKGTLLRVFPSKSPSNISTEERNWIAKGNTIIQLGVPAPPTAANFSQSIEHPLGIIQIESSRRLGLTGEKKAILSDRFGVIIRQKKIENGKLIQVTTPYLAANAFQDAAGNYALLAELVRETTPIWVDEYLHGYKDKQSIEATRESSWFIYLAKTPLLAIAIQSFILLCVIIWSTNQRFGLSREIEVVKTDNSKVYIHSLAMVLARAGASEFVMQVIGKSEKIHLQKRLGLGTKILSHQELLRAWEETGRSKSQLTKLLEPLEQKKRISEKQLLLWLERWQRINNDG